MSSDAKMGEKVAIDLLPGFHLALAGARELWADAGRYGRATSWVQRMSFIGFGCHGEVLGLPTPTARERAW